MGLWEALHAAFLEEVRKSSNSISDFFSNHKTSWNLVGRVCFHLAENKKDEEFPFAFLATYSRRLSIQGKAQYLPLGNALQEYSGEKSKAQLLHLLLPVQRGSERSRFLKSLVD